MTSGFHSALLLCVTSGLLAAASCCEDEKKPSCPAPCPPGWTQFGARCFMFYRTAKKWLEAERTCLSVDGNLASIRSIEEHTFIHDYINRVTGADTRTWIGGFDTVQEGVWMWSDGTPLEYTHWNTGQPDNFHNREHCAEMNWHANFWNDLPCASSLPFMCSKRL